MTIFCLSETLSIRVGRDGVWIWAPAISSQPLHLDADRLEEMGLLLAATARTRSTPPDAASESSHAARNRGTWGTCRWR